jgi:hypothetical protein
MPVPIESSVFRFVSLRQPKMLQEPRPGVAVITYPVVVSQPAQPPIFDPVTQPLPEQTPTVQPVLEGQPPVVEERRLAEEGVVSRPRPSVPPQPADILYQRFLSIRRTNGPRTVYESAVVEYRLSEHWIGSSGALARWTILHEKIQRTPDAASDPSLRTRIEEALRIGPLQQYIASGRSLATRTKLFNNLFATIVLPDDPPLREALLSAIKVEQIIVELAERPSAREEIAGATLSPIAMEFIVVLPKEIFPIPAAAGGITDPPVVPPGEEHSPTVDTDTVRTLEAGLADLEAAEAAERRGRTRELAPATQQLLTTLRIGGTPASLAEARAAVAESLTAIVSSNAQFDVTSRTFRFGGGSVASAELCDPHIPDTCRVYEGGPLPAQPGVVHSLGIADLLVVRQTLKSYVAGEISHITNVMATEERKTTHRHLQRVEETVSIDRETTTESERDLQSTDRFSLSNEAKQVIQDDTKFNAGVTATATYGPVQVTANAAYATTSSQQTSTTVASSYAKEVTQRATEKVTERVREQRSRTTIEEIEETNLHSFTNTTSSHIVGIYQWVDVIYLARLFNLGRRLMLEFVVPEPAAFHVYSSAALQSAGGSTGTDNPVAPTSPSPLGVLNSATDITATNYAAWAARYGANEVEPPPQEWIRITTALLASSPGDGADSIVTDKSSLKVPEGYAADTAYVHLAISNGSGNYGRALIGSAYCLTVLGEELFTLPMAGETGTIPVNMQSAKTYMMANIEILCGLTTLGRDAWKLKTYNAIVSAYEKRKAAYDQAINAGAGPSVFSPSRNRELERQELKRGCLQLLTGQRFGAFSAMRVHQSLDYPEFLDGRAVLEGKYMQFFEQACDWMNMTYTFYPYFWTRKPNWIRMRGYESDDPIFTNFLQAGAARVVVPAHPAYTKALLHYLSTGELWNGDDVPVVGDPLYISIVDELMEGSGFGESSDPVAEWDVRLPTTLTMLKTADPGVLPDWAPH